MPAAAGNPGGGVTDDPSEQHSDVLFNGAGLSSVEPFLGGQDPASRAERSARDLSLVGALKLDPFNLGVHGDVAGWKNLAFVGKWREACPGTGVDIIDITRPRMPVKIADTLDYADTSMEDMQVMKIRGRDILGVGLQDCGNSDTQGTVGLELYDITDPSNPQFLTLVNGEDFGMEAEHGHVHEFDLTRTPDGRTLALLASPDLEALTSNPPLFDDGIGDLLIVDITDPSNPTLLSHWGVLQEPALGLDVYLSVLAGGDPRTLDHSVRANKDGTLAYVSYWDAGFIILDISDPADPVFLGRTEYAPGEEGNAHSVDESPNGQFLAAADEDFSPFETVFSITSGPNAGEYPALEGAFTRPIASLDDRSMNGSTTYIGLACPGDPVPAAPDDGNPLTDETAVALRGVCFFQDKASAAEAAGYDAFIVMNDEARGDELVLMGGSGAVPVPNLPGVFVGHSTGLKIMGAANQAALVVGSTGADIAATAEFNGWGYLRIFDISDPANPVQVSSFATENTNNPDVALDGIWSVHNPEWHGKKAFVSWYSDGNPSARPEGSDLARRGRLLGRGRRPGGRAAGDDLERGPAQRAAPGERPELRPLHPQAGEVGAAHERRGPARRAPSVAVASAEEADDGLEPGDDRVGHRGEQQDEDRGDHADDDGVLGHRLPFLAAPQLFEAQSRYLLLTGRVVAARRTSDLLISSS